MTNSVQESAQEMAERELGCTGYTESAGPGSDGLPRLEDVDCRVIAAFQDEVHSEVFAVVERHVSSRRRYSWKRPHCFVVVDDTTFLEIWRYGDMGTARNQLILKKDASCCSRKEIIAMAKNMTK